LPILPWFEGGAFPDAKDTTIMNTPESGTDDHERDGSGALQEYSTTHG
jgi:hypothetical protein